MIEYIEGDIFESPAQVIVNPVNTIGVMGKGLALEYKKRYPQMFEKYKSVCEKKQLTIGKLMLLYEADHWLLLFPTKENWRDQSKLEYIESGLQKFVQRYAQKNITSVAFPRLGCGNGGLDWEDVKPLMERYLKKLPIDVFIYLKPNPDIVPEHKDTARTIEWLRQNAKDMSYGGVKDDIIHICSPTPYKFEVENKLYYLTSSCGCLHITSTNGDLNLEINDELLHTVWDYIRTNSVFSESKTDEAANLIYGLLYAVGYLSKIKLYCADTNKMERGYQVNSALGRVYTLEVS